EQTQEAAAEAEAQRPRRLRLVAERRVVEAQLLHRVPEVFVLRRVGRVESGEDHGLHFAEAGERLGRRVLVVGDRVADLAVADLLDVGDDEADLAYRQGVAPGGLRREDPHPLHAVRPAGTYEAGPQPLA